MLVLQHFRSLTIHTPIRAFRPPCTCIFASRIMVRLRKKRPAAPEETSPLLTSSKTSGSQKVMSDAEGLRVGGAGSWSVRTQWIFFAVASGACAAFNGVFAKLTTTELTTTFSEAIANLLGLSNVETGVEVVVRAMFFGLNLIFNGVMWSLFTTALARGTSTTQVSIMNTSANFMITAFLGWLIFSEALPAMWWAGAAFLVAGNVIIGRKDESEGAAGGEEYAAVPQAEPQGGERETARKDDEEDEDVIDLGDLNERR